MFGFIRLSFVGFIFPFITTTSNSTLLRYLAHIDWISIQKSPSCGGTSFMISQISEGCMRVTKVDRWLKPRRTSRSSHKHAEPIAQSRREIGSRPPSLITF
ncbi:hypothetical protein BDV40DRAFT_267179 [Aspergillus tamarii]|uniref:Uncharacterized protein n=1 Tax=Aspergillus tamarii TaxID=41984 RepID=A0A5N6USI9_ASPTM|nr:hypothetical protein BDV40DRAFT_267179 [Aspergillus tamarii]